MLYDLFLVYLGGVVTTSLIAGYTAGRFSERVEERHAELIIYCAFWPVGCMVDAMTKLGERVARQQGEQPE